MKYNFVIYIIISVIIGSPIIFLKKDILKEFTFIEEMVCTSFLILIISSIIYKLYDNKNISDLINKYYYSNKYNNYLLYIFLIVISILLSNYIISIEKRMIRYRSFKISVSLIATLLIGAGIFNENIKIPQISGIILIMSGLCLVY